jgi:hypothetical protein
MVQRILQHRRIAMVILRRDEHEPVCGAHFLRHGSAAGSYWPDAGGMGLSMKGSGPVAQVDQLKGCFAAPGGAFHEPASDGLTLAPLSGAAEDDENVRLHTCTPGTVVVIVDDCSIDEQGVSQRDTAAIEPSPHA